MRDGLSPSGPQLMTTRKPLSRPSCFAMTAIASKHLATIAELSGGDFRRVRQHVRFWRYQDVDGRHGVYILERNDVLVLIDFGAGGSPPATILQIISLMVLYLLILYGRRIRSRSSWNFENTGCS